jgi:hypothetical protein
MLRRHACQSLVRRAGISFVGLNNLLDFIPHRHIYHQMMDMLFYKLSLFLQGCKCINFHTVFLQSSNLAFLGSKTLSNESFSIFNKYSNLYSASRYSRKVVGHDDFKSLLKFVNLGLEKWDEEEKPEQRG